MLRRSICVALTLSIVLGSLPPVMAGEWLDRTFGRKSNVERLAVSLDRLEKRLGLYGSVVAKGPDVWGQARLTRHRDEFEQQMAQQLDKFNFTLNGELARTDQSYLLQALSLSATLNAAKTPGGGTGGTTNVAAATAAPSNTAQDPASLLDSVTIKRAEPFQLLKSQFPGAAESGAFYLAVEPEVLLDQRARYLNHLHELRRINEGDDTADSPGYSLNLVRIPISVLPGDRTREGYGAEITITATPYITQEMLPDTFRALIINDLVDQLALPITQILDQKWDKYLSDERDVENAKEFIDQLSKARRDNFSGTVDDLILRSPRLGSLKPLNILGLEGNKKVMSVEAIALQKMTPDAIRSRQLKDSIPPPKEALSSVRGLSPRGRRSRYAIPSSQMVDVFGAKGLDRIARTAFSVRDQYQCQNPPYRMHLAEVQSFLRGELDAAYEFVSHRGSDPGTAGPQTGPGGMPGRWMWAVENYKKGRLVDAIRGTSSEIRIKRDSYYSTAQDPGFLLNGGVRRAGSGTRNVSQRSRKQSDIRLARFELSQLPDSEPNPVPPSDPEFPIRAPRADRVDVSDSTDEIAPQNATEALSWAVVVESVLLNEQLKEDMQRVSQDPDCGCHPGYNPDLLFFLPDPGPTEKQMFTDYVRCRWPIHVFALDPVTQQQNIADTYALRRETQIALAVAFTGGNISGKSLTRYMRRIEQDMRTIELNNTIIGFGHGTDTFGWRFLPRFQTPPVESNLTVFGRDLLWGGPTRDDQLRKQRIEQGMRECTAIVVMPSFVRHVTFKTRSNWFALANCNFSCRSDSGAKLLNTVEWSREIRCMEELAECAYEEADLYRPDEIELLRNRMQQLSHRLPTQTMHSQVPYENTLGGFEMFSSGVTDLAPELIGYYGAPGIDPNKQTELFLVGNHFSVHDTQVIAGNVKCHTNLLSRQVMRVSIPAGVRVEQRRAVRDAASSADSDNAVLSPTASTIAPAVNSNPGCSGKEDPCCSKEYVEIRLATPYGIAGQLHVPVVASPECAPDLQWSVKNYPLTYYWSQSGTNPIDVGDQDVKARPPFRIAIKVPKNVVVASNKVDIDIAMIGQDTGIGPVAQLTGIPFDARNSQYVIDASNFITLQKGIRATVLNNFKASNFKKPPSDDYVIELQATVNVGDNKIGVSDSLTIPIHFDKKP